MPVVDLARQDPTWNSRIQPGTTKANMEQESPTWKKTTMEWGMAAFDADSTLEDLETMQDRTPTQQRTPTTLKAEDPEQEHPQTHIKGPGRPPPSLLTTFPTDTDDLAHAGRTKPCQLPGHGIISHNIFGARRRARFRKSALRAMRMQNVPTKRLTCPHRLWRLGDRAPSLPPRNRTHRHLLRTATGDYSATQDSLLNNGSRAPSRHCRGLPWPHPPSPSTGRNNASHHPAHPVTYAHVVPPQHAPRTATQQMQHELPLTREDQPIPQPDLDRQRCLPTAKEFVRSKEELRESSKGDSRLSPRYKISSFQPTFGCPRLSLTTIARTRQSTLWPSGPKWPSTAPRTH
ncbi:hypothetical protein BHM03_00001076 [Ensete ventricosum]|uniref:Uncharacterized protein n=1 Tax=Ensete ventricosum TaxID=4639 RepID=A0A445M8X2_ENSVE|nr:hypothetical protein BHM03_00001076 [Ensete ventricosum]